MVNITHVLLLILFIFIYQVISVHDCDSLYRVPVVLAEQNIVPLLKERLGLAAITLPLESQSYLKIWHELAER